MTGKDADRRTTLYLIRHAATEANLARPARLQGRRHNAPLARLGIRQAEATRDYLASYAIQHCYSSPLLRAMQTAAVVTVPHRLTPQALPALTECDVGRWEGMDWQSIRYLDAQAYQHFLESPAGFGYPGGETFADVYHRATECLNGLLKKHEGESILVVGHQVVNRIYLGSLMGMGPEQARQVSVDNCGISLVVCEDGSISVSTVNAAFHLHNIAA